MINDWTTLLFVPADRPDRFAKAAASGADAIVVDLEDAVAADRKDAARQALRQIATVTDPPPIVVRINAVGTQWHRQDLAALADLRIAAVMLPKAEAGAESGDWPLIALVETPRGIATARDMAARGARLAFGSIDYSAALGSAHSREALLSARSELVLASALAGVAPPIDGVTTAIDAPDLCEADARYAQTLGFAGKLCIHPSQVAPVRSGFAPTESELAWAQAVLSAGGDGAQRLDGAMIDAPVRARAARILRRDRER